jgi:hypothetical protein
MAKVEYGKAGGEAGKLGGNRDKQIEAARRLIPEIGPLSTKRSQTKKFQEKQELPE